MVVVLDDLRPEGHPGLGGHADCLLVLLRSPDRLDVLAIPRDTWIPEIAGKANGLTWTREGRTGREILGRFLGQPIQGHVLVTLDGLVRAVDRLGGLEATVGAPMSGADHAGGGQVRLRAGRQAMSGRDLVGWLRLRKSRSDLVRMDRLRTSAFDLAGQLPGPGTLIGLLPELSGEVEIDEPPGEWPAWIGAVRNGRHSPHTWTILAGHPGRRGRLWTWEADTGQLPGSHHRAVALAQSR